MTRPAPDPAQDSARAAFESFLVEDVILTLGNLRGSLLWLGEGAAAERSCIDRLDRQLALLVDRAHRMARQLRSEVAAPEPANVFAMPATSAGIPAPRAIDATMPDHTPDRDEEAQGPVFRSRRA